MKTTAYAGILIMSCVVFSSCSDRSDSAAALGIKGKWTMRSLTLEGQQVRSLAQAPVTITFDENRVTGSGGCNSFDGEFAASREGEFQVQEQHWTEMACDDPVIMQREMDFVEVLWKVNTFSTANEQLILSDGSSSNQVIFVRHEPAEPLPLLGTTWSLDTFEITEMEDANPDEAAASVSSTPTLDEAPITLVVVSDGVGGRSGCNNYSADAEVGDGEFSIEGVSLTRMACLPEVMEQERQFIDALTQVTRYAIVDDQLRLINPDGTLTLHFSGQHQTDDATSDEAGDDSSR